MIVLFHRTGQREEKASQVRGTKKPLLVRGLALLHIPLILRQLPPELAPFLLGQAGCRASSGRFPPPLLMRAISLLFYCSCACMQRSIVFMLLHSALYAKQRTDVNALTPLDALSLKLSKRIVATMIRLLPA